MHDRRAFVLIEGLPSHSLLFYPMITPYRFTLALSPGL
jgi:hypothetical protein